MTKMMNADTQMGRGHNFCQHLTFTKNISFTSGKEKEERKQKRNILLFNSLEEL